LGTSAGVSGSKKPSSQHRRVALVQHHGRERRIVFAGGAEVGDPARAETDIERHRTTDGLGERRQHLLAPGVLPAPAIHVGGEGRWLRQSASGNRGRGKTGQSVAAIDVKHVIPLSIFPGEVKCC
jgi:hypothetical protein